MPLVPQDGAYPLRLSTPRCPKCRAYGHERDDCVRCYARVAARSVSDGRVYEEEAGRAAAPVKPQAK